jgi:DNA-binding PadR family transcriptional regulator
MLLRADCYHITISLGDNMIRNFFLGFVKIHILHHAAQEPIYGLAMIEELRRHGYDVSPGTIYPVLHGLEQDGYLTRENRVVGGKVRKYYAITDDGQAALEEARVKIGELTREVIEGQEPAHLPGPTAPNEQDPT